MYDLDEHMLRSGQPTDTWSVGHPTYDLEYADHTLLMSLTIQQMRAFLTGLAKEAAKYGVRLNEEKTELLSSTPDHTALKFLTGNIVTSVSQAKYLGFMISWNKPFKAAFHHRLGVAETAFKHALGLKLQHGT